MTVLLLASQFFGILMTVFNGLNFFYISFGDLAGLVDRARESAWTDSVRVCFPVIPLVWLEKIICGS